MLFGWIPLIIIITLSLCWPASAFAPKNTGDQLTHTDWNGLPNDFFDKRGDTWAGPGGLNMGNNKITGMAAPADPADVATRKYVTDNKSGGSAKSRSGSPLRILCGRTTSGSTNWKDHSPGTIYIDINTASAGFASIPVYQVSLGGADRQYLTKGVTSIESASPQAFRVIINYIASGTFGAGEANVRLWYLNWCAIGS